MDLNAMKLYLYDTTKPLQLTPMSSQAKADSVKPTREQPTGGTAFLTMGGYKVARRPGGIDPMQMWRFMEWSIAHAGACNSKAKDIIGHGWEWEDGIETPQTEEIEAVLDRSRKALYDICRDVEVTGWADIELREYAVGRRLYSLEHVPSWSCWPTLDGERILHRTVDHLPPVVYDTIGFESGNPLMVQVNGNTWPTNSYYGVPDAVAAFPLIQSIHAAIEYNKEFFERRGGYRWLVILEDPQNQNNAEGDAALVQKIHYNVSEVGKTGSKTDMLIIPVGDRKVVLHKLDADAQDMNFAEMFNVYRNEILAANEVPPLVANYIETGALGGEVGTEQLVNYRDSTIRPKQEMIWEPALNQIIQYYWPGAPELRLKQLFVDERKIFLPIIMDGFDRNIFTVNEVREAAGYDPLDDGDVRGNEIAVAGEFQPRRNRDREARQ